MIEKYNKLTLKGKNTFWMIVIGIFGTIVLLPWCLMSNPGLSLGFLVGSIIEVACYRLICITSETITKAAEGNAKNYLVLLSTFGFFIRFALYGVGLVLGALDTFRWKTNTLNIWTVFAAYLPMAIIIAVTTLKSNKIESQK